VNWSHYNPVRIVAGAGIHEELGKYLPTGELLLLTTEGMLRRGTADNLVQSCPAGKWTVRAIGTNPDLDSLDVLANTLRATDYHVVVALGGGSAMDAAKVLSVLLPAHGKVVLHQWLREGSKAPLPKGIPVYCLPTTAGTGAEVTPFATVWDNREKCKRSLEGDQIYPDTALLDPKLTLTLPWEETLYSALDALSQGLETLWNRHATPVSAAFAVRAVNIVLESLPVVEKEPENLRAREHLQQASLLSGLAISQSRTALAHSISYPLTVRYGVPHGLACSFTLPALIKWVQQEGAWTIDVDARILDKILEMLENYDLYKRIREYCTIEEVVSCADGMFTPERSGNFVLSVNLAKLTSLIRP
jgi:alcohol dehydrogenase